MMAPMALTLILGNQLFPDWTSKSPIQLGPKDSVLMVEDAGIASRFRYHSIRIHHTFVAMREFRDHLVNSKIKVHYFEFEESQNMPFFERIEQEIGKDRILRFAGIPDRSFRAELEAFCKRSGIQGVELPSPQFLCGEKNFREYLKSSKRPFMKTFYERERKRLNILVDSKGQPTGGQWSFDVENRKKLPKNYQEPKLPLIQAGRHDASVAALIRKHFAQHPGTLGPRFLPSNRKEALDWLSSFLKERLTDFGPYEDAITSRFETLNHSLLSPLINLGLLNPDEVVARALEHAKKHRTPIASLEGFIRQVIGWREFILGIDAVYGEKQHASNFFGHHRTLTPAWYQGTTGIPPLDDAIRKADRLAYLHHIERLMIVSNLMLLCQIAPPEVYRWFMEMQIDSYEWVMGPNVFGMGQMSDGGIFATKPYISGSNYILKMSDYPKGPWCEIWDGLYWSFIDRNRGFFSKNPRLSMMVKLLDKMPEPKRKTLLGRAQEFTQKMTGPPRARSAFGTF